MYWNFHAEKVLVQMSKISNENGDFDIFGDFFLKPNAPNFSAFWGDR